MSSNGPQKPAHIREFTPRSVAVGLLVALIMGASYPYMVLKFGFGPNVSVVSAFFGFVALGLFSKSYNRWENNIVQTAGTTAGQIAFLCWLLAAFDILGAEPGSKFQVRLTWAQTWIWLSASGLLGVFLAVPLRRHFIEDEQLRFADGVAAGETLIMLDSRGPQARRSTFVPLPRANIRVSTARPPLWRRTHLPRPSSPEARRAEPTPSLFSDRFHHVRPSSGGVTSSRSRASTVSGRLPRRRAVPRGVASQS